MTGDPGQAAPRPAAPVSAPLPVGGAFGPPGGVLGPPGGTLGPPGGALVPPGGAFGLPGGAPGGAFGPPGGLPPPPAPLLALAPGGGFPGAGTPLALPDLQGMARQAMETVVEGVAQPPAAASAATAAPPAPAPPPGPPTGPPHNPWHAPPPRPARRHQSGWPAPRVLPEERDRAQRIGDRLYPLVERLRDSRLSWVAVVALFGITVPIILLRQSFDVRLRLVLAALTFLFWIGLIQDIG